MQDPLRADDGIRTRDPHLGKVMLYQLSHVRIAFPEVFVPFERKEELSGGWRRMQIERRTFFRSPSIGPATPSPLW